MKNLPSDPFCFMTGEKEKFLLTQMGIGGVAMSFGHEGEYSTIEFAERLKGDDKPLGSPLDPEDIGELIHMINFRSLEALENFHHRLGELVEAVRASKG